MANRSIEELENNAKAETGVTITLLTSLAALVVGAGINSAVKGSNRQKLQLEIQEIDREISNYKSKFLGSLMYGDEISQLEQKRAEKMQQLKQC